jgi:hypothetical protein
VLSALLVSSAVACGLVATEVFPHRSKDDQVDIRDEPARKILYVARLARQNFKDMGLNDEQAAEAFDRAADLRRRRTKLFESILAENQSDIGLALCEDPARLPTVYSAMEWIVEQRADARGVLHPDDLLDLRRQEWYASRSSVKTVYEAIDSAKQRSPNATVLGVAAILAMREKDARDRVGPWSVSGFSDRSLGGVEALSPGVTPKVIEYLAMMHVLTEIARRPNGICR